MDQSKIIREIPERKGNNNKIRQHRNDRLSNQLLGRPATSAPASFGRVPELEGYTETICSLHGRQLEKMKQFTWFMNLIV